MNKDRSGWFASEKVAVVAQSIILLLSVFHIVTSQSVSHHSRHKLRLVEEAWICSSFRRCFSTCSRRTIPSQFKIKGFVTAFMKATSINCIHILGEGHTMCRIAGAESSKSMCPTPRSRSLQGRLDSFPLRWRSRPDQPAKGECRHKCVRHHHGLAQHF